MEERYDNVRANVTFHGLDARNRGRVQVSAELPLLYPLGRAAGCAPSSSLQRASPVFAIPALSSVPMRTHLEIRSGGQTGVDRGALDAALELGNPCGGWCPDGRQAEDGPIPDRYPLTELAGAGYPERTRRNVEDSDGTLIIHCGSLSAGTLFTLTTCEELRMPVCLIDAATVEAGKGAEVARAFLHTHDIRRLNVAGPRASQWPQAQHVARDLVRALLAEPLASGLT